MIPFYSGGAIFNQDLVESNILKFQHVFKIQNDALLSPLLNPLEGSTM
jgi:hypothetical protein